MCHTSYWLDIKSQLVLTRSLSSLHRKQYWLDCIRLVERPQLSQSWNRQGLLTFTAILQDHSHCCPARLKVTCSSFKTIALRCILEVRPLDPARSKMSMLYFVCKSSSGSTSWCSTTASSQLARQDSTTRLNLTVGLLLPGYAPAVATITVTATTAAPDTTHQALHRTRQALMAWQGFRLEDNFGLSWSYTTELASSNHPHGGSAVWQLACKHILSQNCLRRVSHHDVSHAWYYWLSHLQIKQHLFNQHTTCLTYLVASCDKRIHLASLEQNDLISCVMSHQRAFGLWNLSPCLLCLGNLSLSLTIDVSAHLSETAAITDYARTPIYL